MEKFNRKEIGVLEYYEDYSRLSLCRELDQYKRRHLSDSDVIDLYRRAFTFLETQKWFKDNRHTLDKFLSPIVLDGDE